MTRLDGEKKSPLPWIIGLIVLALLAAAIYYLTANKTPDNAVDVNSPALQSTAGGANAANANATDANATDANATDANATDANSTDANAASGNMADSNAADSNSAMTSNSATGDANSAVTSKPTISDANAPMIDNAANNSAMPGVTPVAGNAKPKGDGIVATRSKTIKTKDATVTYKKSVKSDGSLMHDKEIVPKPVEQAKKMQ